MLPSGFGTICKGLDQQLLDRRQIPISIILSNSFFALVRRSGAKRRARALIGGPVVGIASSTPCLVFLLEKSEFVIAGNFFRSCEKWLNWGEVPALMRLGVLVIDWEDGACV